MIVVADTSPLNYLIQIECDNLLLQLYERVLIPRAVMKELSHPSSPISVRSWLAAVPEWAEVRETNVQPDPTLSVLDIGEREAIQLAQESHADLLLIDERKGRAEAKRRGLATTGTLGVLLSAGELGFVDPKAACQRLLTETSFRITPELREKFFGSQ